MKPPITIYLYLVSIAKFNLIKDSYRSDFSRDHLKYFTDIPYNGKKYKFNNFKSLFQDDFLEPSSKVQGNKLKSWVSAKLKEGNLEHEVWMLKIQAYSSVDILGKIFLTAYVTRSGSTVKHKIDDLRASHYTVRYRLMNQKYVDV